MPLSMVDLGWIAGLIEGEGYIGRIGRKSQPVASLEIYSTDRDVIERLVKLLGGKTKQREQCLSARKYSKGQTKTLYYVRWNSARAAAIIMTIFPLLSERRKASAIGSLELWKAHPKTRGRLAFRGVED
jgi:hypothetical protein